MPLRDEQLPRLLGKSRRAGGASRSVNGFPGAIRVFAPLANDGHSTVLQGDSPFKPSSCSTSSVNATGLVKAVSIN